MSAKSYPKSPEYRRVQSWFSILPLLCCVSTGFSIGYLIGIETSAARLWTNICVSVFIVTGAFLASKYRIASAFLAGASFQCRIIEERLDAAEQGKKQ